MEKLSANYRFKKNLGFTLLTFVLGWAIFTFLLFPNLSLLKISCDNLNHVDCLCNHLFICSAN